MWAQTTGGHEARPAAWFGKLWSIDLPIIFANAKEVYNPEVQPGGP